MRFPLIIILLFVTLSLLACNNYEKENNHLKDELRMVREESDYLKAEIVGLKKEMAHLTAKVEEERNGLQKKFQEERETLQKRFAEERETLQKKTQEALKKKNGNITKEPVKKEVTQKEGAAVPKKDVKDLKETAPKHTQPHTGDTKPPQPSQPLRDLIR